MKILACLSMLVCLVGCSSLALRTTAEEELTVVAKEVFEQEDVIPKERSFFHLDFHRRTHEATLRDVEREKNEERLEPLLKNLRVSYSRDHEGFIAAIQRVVDRSGCSKALGALLQDLPDPRIDFLHDLYREHPKLKCRYSKTLMEDRTIYGPLKTL